MRHPLAGEDAAVAPFFPCPRKDKRLDPYAVLAVPRGASREEVVRAAATAMKARRHPPQLIAQAQKTLMDPEKRLLADFLQPLLPTPHRYRRPEIVQGEGGRSDPEEENALATMLGGLDEAEAAHRLVVEGDTLPSELKGDTLP